MEHSFDSPGQDPVPVTERVTSSKARRYLVAAALLSGGVTLGAVFSPIGLANAQSDDTTSSTADDDSSSTTADDPGSSDTDTADDQGRGHGPGGHGPGGRGAKLESLASILGLDIEALRTEIEAGATLAELAESQGVSEDDLVAAMVGHLEDHLDDAVAAGRIDRSEADEKLAEAEAAIRDRLDDEIPLGGRGLGGPAGRGFGGLGGEIQDLADALDLDLETLRDAVMGGQTVAEAAAAQGVTADELTAALVDSATSHIDEALDAGRIDQATADELKAELDTRVDEFVNGSLADGFGFGPGGFDGRPGGHDSRGPRFGHHDRGPADTDGSSSSDDTDNGETQESGYTA